VKRAFLTLFLLFYTFSVVGLTVERTEEWAGQRAGDLKHHQQHPQHSAKSGEAHKRTPHASQTKLYEDGVILIGFIPTSDLPQSETGLHYRSIDFVPSRNSRSVSSRAPPAFVQFL